MSMAHAEAYTRLFPFLTRITLPRGLVDIERNIPPRDIEMIANEAATMTANGSEVKPKELITDSDNKGSLELAERGPCL